jgi:hypothetical protein
MVTGVSSPTSRPEQPAPLSPADFGLRGFFSPAFFARALIVVFNERRGGSHEGRSAAGYKRFITRLIVVFSEQRGGFLPFGCTVVPMFECSILDRSFSTQNPAVLVCVLFGHVAKCQEQKVRNQMIATGASTLQRVSKSI